MAYASDDIIHQPLRLKIMAALNALQARDTLDFTRLKAMIDATDGNLGAHLATLERAGYIKIEKEFVGKKPRTSVAMTREGRKAFGQHVAYLRDILEGATSGKP